MHAVRCMSGKQPKQYIDLSVSCHNLNAYQKPCIAKGIHGLAHIMPHG